MPERERGEEQESRRERKSESEAETDSHGVQTTQTETQTQTLTRPSIAKTQKEETFLLACNALMSSSQPATETEARD